MAKYWPYVLIIGTLLRVGFFCFGVYQDAYFTVKYTDIDYYVFNDAARFVYYGNHSPYLRDTYRYTPLLSYILLPNFYFNNIHLGKFIFVLFDLLTGILIYKMLLLLSLSNKGKSEDTTEARNSQENKAAVLSAIWLFNPIVVTISTRGNAESVLCAIIMSSLFCMAQKHYILGGLLFGLSIHFKLYPIIYSITIVTYYLVKNGVQSQNWKRGITICLKIGLSALVSFTGLTYAMYKLYGFGFLYHSYLYHFIRSDHRHNFSLWNMLLYLESSPAFEQLQLSHFGDGMSSALATLSQMLVSSIAVPSLLFASKGSTKIEFIDFMNVIFAQTFAFVMFNKVITSQYFIWYLVFVPVFLLNCGSLISWRKSASLVAVWFLSQAQWLGVAYLLEFEGMNVFFPWLFAAHVLFFLGNLWILGQIVECIRNSMLKRDSAIQEKKNK